MILSVGEILIDLFNTPSGISKCVGGAPFNVAVGAKRAGGKVAFVGKVGDDADGNFILDNTTRYNLDLLGTGVLAGHKTTVAEVTLDDDGERFFRFLRNNTADYQLSIDDIDFDTLKPTIVHIGTLMLSEKMGRDFALKLLKKAKEFGANISVDVNFRDDIFEGKTSRNEAMKPLIDGADFLKMSIDEILDYTGQTTLENAVKSLKCVGALFVTDGDKGSHVFFEKECDFIPSKKVDAIDTTGAGDAYWGTALAYLDNLIESGTPLTINTLENVAEKANLAGAHAVTRLGAI
ncbi:MAG: carbohydrate kinase [Clostridia bacterium]|nr:carbohydrate kinase [Clostridia bacterium]